MSALARLGLGTAQFGMPYGISNEAGQPSEHEVARILSCATELGVGYLDTAGAYGDAEALVGRLSPADHAIRIVTKALPQKRSAVPLAEQLRDGMKHALARLKTGKVYGLLVHYARDLGGPDGDDIVAALRDLKERQLVDKIGVSAYSSEEIKLVLKHFIPDIVQVPVNALDRRLVESGTLQWLAARGVEIHARSVFLQGLLLMRPDRLPPFFAPMREDVAALHRQWKDSGLTPLAGCLAAVLAINEVSAVIVGVNSAAELREIADAVVSAAPVEIKLPAARVDPTFLNPANWPPAAG